MEGQITIDEWITMNKKAHLYGIPVYNQHGELRDVSDILYELETQSERIKEDDNAISTND